MPIHNDSTFLYTDPPSAVGFWFALEPCTLTNGCLVSLLSLLPLNEREGRLADSSSSSWSVQWFLPGSHKTQPLRERFVRVPEGGTGFEKLSDEPEPEWDLSKFKAEPCDAGEFPTPRLLLFPRSSFQARPCSADPDASCVRSSSGTLVIIHGLSLFCFCGTAGLVPSFATADPALFRLLQ